jgi:NAD(P)-dependent dehydrogenase (short-subunit alcohol dehydrogenase family)
MRADAFSDRMKGRKVLVTGAGRGIGRATAALFTQHGARVACLDIDGGALRARADPLIDTDENLMIEADAMIVREIVDAVEQTVACFGGLDVLVNNVGLSTRGSIEETSEGEWDRVSQNTKGVYLASRAALPHMRKSGGGAIVNIGSGAGLPGFPGVAAYGTSKAGVVALTRLMAMDHGQDGIRVNCVCPGLTDTNISRHYRRIEAEKSGRTFEEVTQMALSRYPLGRIGQPIDVARAVLFLASDEASWITGATLMVDGGRSAGAY